MKRHLSWVLGLVGLALAASSRPSTVISFASQSFTGNLRSGPYVFVGSLQKPVEAQVSTLHIAALKAALSAPAGVPMPEAQGRRHALFTGHVVVTRSHLTALGPSLIYSERTGLGILAGPATMVYRPVGPKATPVHVEANQMSFDVTTSISVSSGNVRLQNGLESASSSRLLFDQHRQLAILSGKAVQLKRLPRVPGHATLTLRGTEERVLTGKKLVLVQGHVQLVDGQTTTTGTVLYYDDHTHTAIVEGSPAVSYNAASQTTIRGGTLEVRTDLNRVQQLAGTFPIPTKQFLGQ
jgi:lipopolysaccharide export system protein LptA